MFSVESLVKERKCTQILAIQLSTDRMHGPVLSENQGTETHCARKEGKGEDASEEKSLEHCLKREVRDIPLHVEIASAVNATVFTILKPWYGDDGTYKLL